MAEEKNTSIADLLRRISFNPHKRADRFLALTPEMRATTLLRLSRRVRRDLLSRIGDDDIAVTTAFLDPDEATDILQLLPARRRDRIVGQLNADLKKSVGFLMGFGPETAAGLMSIDYIHVDEEDTIEGVARQFKVHEDRTGRSPAIMVMRNGILIGHVPGHELGFGNRQDGIKNRIRKIATIRHDAAQDEVRRLFRQRQHDKVAVVGDAGQVVGIIYADDLLRLLDENESASLYNFAGVNEEESVSDSATRKVRHRYKWLFVNLATAFLAASTVHLFQDTVSKFVLLAVYMPIVAGMGGNAATQTLAVMVRGIALDQITLAHAGKTLLRELGAGLANGLLNGAIIAGIVIIVNRDYRLAAILSAALVFNLLVAAFFGTLVPLIMHRLGKDPATSATVFITTATDVLGFLAFLGMATLFLA